MWAKSRKQITKAGAAVSLTFLLVITSAQGFAQSIEFTPDFNGTVAGIVIQADGKILVAGGFSRINEVLHSQLARLNSDGSVDGNLDVSYNPVISGTVEEIALQSDGKVIAVGNFLNVNDPSVQRLGIARFNDNGSVDKVFSAELSSRAVGLALQADGKILVGGAFNTVANNRRGRMARLDVDGGLEQLLGDICIPLVPKNGAIAIICL